ncbi:MAG: ATP-binding protein, partial [Kangiellaceae bacterium]|nr:ATP-binding protein [Kangiellaceae bacterium]
MASGTDFELRYSHNIIEHLGLKLYQNKPTNVLAELVSNSWDADAKNVWLDLNQSHLAVYDDGVGMSREELSLNYLVIGKKKRVSGNLDSVTNRARKLMGRKGIGKLAPFGIAQKISLLTISKESSKCCWIELDLSKLLRDSVDKSHQEFNYKPRIVCDNVAKEEIPISEDRYGYVQKFLESTKETGTLVIMEDLSLKKGIPERQLMVSLGQRFTVTLLRDDFSVHVNDIEVTEKQALPTFAYRIPEEGYKEETINLNGRNRDVRYWVGFVEQAEWPQDQAGVGVYTHGKIAQDRPFVFGLKGREISTRYMYGVIEADWLDELEEDVVSTDRTSINWENDDTEEMHKWGKDIVAKWINDYRKFQRSQNEAKVLERINTIPNLPKITSSEKATIKDMVCSMSPKIYRDEKLQTEVLEKLTSAWTHRPTRNIIKSLWDRIEKSEGNEEEFTN